MPKKSLAVIIPNYNKKLYIIETIESILKQTLLPNEIIIVDDCSNDVSKDIILDYANKYPKLIKAFFFKKNNGVQFARNYGVIKANSEYITFIDSDDLYYDKHKLENEMALVGPKKIVFSKYCILNNDTKKISFPNYYKLEELIFKKNALYCYLNYNRMLYWPYCFIISKLSFQKVNGYDFPYNYYEDLDLLIKLKINKVKFVKNKKTYGYERREEANDIEHLSSDIKKKKKVDDEFDKRYKKYKKKKLRYIFWNFISKCIQHFAFK